MHRAPVLYWKPLYVRLINSSIRFAGSVSRRLKVPQDSQFWLFCGIFAEEKDSRAGS